MKKKSLFDADKRQKKKEVKRMVGSAISKETFDYLSLYCLAENSSKSKVVRDLIVEFLNNATDTELLIKKVIKRSLTVYEILKKKKQVESIDEFLELLHEELIEREINKAYIKVIIANVKNYGTDKTT